jgi:hypothetical protein
MYEEHSGAAAKLNTIPAILAAKALFEAVCGFGKNTEGVMSPIIGNGILRDCYGFNNLSIDLVRPRSRS